MENWNYEQREIKAFVTSIYSFTKLQNAQDNLDAEQQGVIQGLQTPFFSGKEMDEV